MRKLRILSITLILTLLLGTAASFAESWSEPPTDSSNPVITISYDRTKGEADLKKPYHVSYGLEKLTTGFLDMGGILYTPQETWTAQKLLSTKKSLWFSTSTNIYRMSLIGEISPDTSDTTVSDDTNYQYTYIYELIPISSFETTTDETLTIPTSSKVETNNHYDYEREYEEQYVVNKKTVDLKTYKAAKKTTDKLVDENIFEEYRGHISNEKIKTTIVYTGLETQKKSKVVNDSTVTYTAPLYHFRKDIYYTVVDDYLRIHNLYVNNSERKVNTNVNKANGHYKGTITNMKDLPSITLKSVAGGNKTITVRWTKCSKSVDGYRIQYATKKNFSDAKVVKVGKNVTSTKIKGLKKNKTYYIRVKAVKGDNSSKWSLYKIVKTR